MELSSSDWDLFVDGSFHDNIILAENSNVLGEPIHAQLGMQMEMEMVEIGHLDSIQDLAPLPHGEQEGPYPQMMPLLPPPPPPPVPLPDTQNLELLNQNYFLDEEKSLSPPSDCSSSGDDTPAHQLTQHPFCPEERSVTLPRVSEVAGDPQLLVVVRLMLCPLTLPEYSRLLSTLSPEWLRTVPYPGLLYVCNTNLIPKTGTANANYDGFRSKLNAFGPRDHAQFPSKAGAPNSRETLSIDFSLTFADQPEKKWSRVRFSLIRQVGQVINDEGVPEERMLHHYYLSNQRALSSATLADWPWPPGESLEELKKALAAYRAALGLPNLVAQDGRDGGLAAGDIPSRGSRRGAKRTNSGPLITLDMVFSARHPRVESTRTFNPGDICERSASRSVRDTLPIP